MNSHKLKLKELQKIWYKRLKEQGFHDIEDEPPSPHVEPFLTQWHSSHFSLTFTESSFRDIQDYYYRANQFLNSYTFNNPVERTIWLMHIRGMGCRPISLYLTKLDPNAILSGERFNKDKVQGIIKKLKELLKKSFSGGDGEKKGSDSYS